MNSQHFNGKKITNLKKDQTEQRSQEKYIMKKGKEIKREDRKKEKEKTKTEQREKRNNNKKINKIKKP